MDIKKEIENIISEYIQNGYVDLDGRINEMHNEIKKELDEKTIDKCPLREYNIPITEYLKFAVLFTSLKRKPVQIRCSPNSTVIDDEQKLCH